MNINTTTPVNITFNTSSATARTAQVTPRSTHQEMNNASHQQRSGLKQNKTFRNFMYFGTAISSLFYLGLNVYIVGQVGQIRNTLEKLNQQNKATQATSQTSRQPKVI
jgi:hypothetical protein